MTVEQLIRNLQQFAWASPTNKDAEIVIRMEDDLFFDFDAQGASDPPDKNFLLLKANFHGTRAKMSEVKPT